MPYKNRSLRIAVSVALTSLLAPTASAQYLFFGWNISEFQPDLVQGGRANTISVNPKSNDEILVASESGGLFHSVNRGVTWKHVTSLPEFYTSAVAYLPTDPTIVIATTGEDTRVANGGGIWRSTDGGLTWKQMSGPSAPTGVTQRLSAFEISIAPDSGTIYVGTAYGVSISRDRGATWTHVDPFGSGDHRVLSVLGQSGNHVLAAGPAGIRRSKDGGATWLAPTTSTGTANVSDIHALGASPYENDQAYAVNWDTDLYFTEDGGDHWTRIFSAAKGGGECGGIAFVKAILAPPPLRTVTLYEGNRCGISRLSAPAIAGTLRFDYGGTWTALNADHGDTRDLAFTSAPRQPLLLATDGGLHKTSDMGLHWTFTGGGHNGYNALQLTEVKGQWITGPPRYDLYIGTQDTELWASDDEGASWTHHFCCEGFFIEFQRRIAAASDNQTTFVGCGPCADLRSNSLFAGWGLWSDATSPPAANPKFIRKSFHVQGVDSSKAFSSGYALTTNLGSTWSQYATFPESRRDLPKLSDPGAQPVLYQSIRTGYDPLLGLEVDDLARIVKRLFAPGADVTYPMMNRFGSLGINRTTFAWYQVFGVDPANTKHLIAPDIVNEKMMETKDGADNWNEIPNLTSKITNAGQFLFRRGIFPQASAVSFSPEDPNLVAIGTSQAGLFISGNRGATWSKVPGSDPVTYITSIEWRTANEAFVSTYGRGLWRLRWGLIRALPDFERLCKFVCTIRPLPPPTEPVERFKHAVLVFNGRIQGTRTSNGRLTELFISPGGSVVFFSDSKKDTNVKVTERRQIVGFSGAMMPPAPDSRRAVLVGLTLGEHGNLLGAAFTGNTVPMYEPTEKEKNQDRQPSGRQTSPTAGRPYLRLILPGGSAANAVLPGALLTITGRNFQRGAPLEIEFDDIAVATVRGGEKGEFSVGIKAPRDFGLHSVTVRQVTAQKVIDGAMFIVTHEDHRRDQR